MDYEKKYKNSLEKMKGFYTYCKRCENKDTVAFLEDAFPELKESEDERIRKTLIEYFNEQCDMSDWNGVYGYQVVAWLEKQGNNQNWKPSKEQISALEHFVRSIEESGYASPYDTNTNLLNSLINDLKKLEKRSEQNDSNVKDYNSIDPHFGKPIDKVEPKFKVGDWITNSIETVQITGYDIDYGYQVDYKGNLQHRDTDIIEKEYHLWSIEDAKDGDVLVASDGSIFLFAGVVDCACKYYAALTTDNYIKINKEAKGGYWETSKAVYPATKEQRELLFQKMKEAGYEWDDEPMEVEIIIKQGEQK